MVCCGKYAWTLSAGAQLSIRPNISISMKACQTFTLSVDQNFVNYFRWANRLKVLSHGFVDTMVNMSGDLLNDFNLLSFHPNHIDPLTFFHSIFLLFFWSSSCISECSSSPMQDRLVFIFKTDTILFFICTAGKTSTCFTLTVYLVDVTCDYKSFRPELVSFFFSSVRFIIITVLFY